MSAEVNLERKNAERIFARAFTVLGGVFWIGLAFAGPYVYGGQTVLGAFQTAIFPIAFTIGILVLGWFYERLTALILALAAVGTIAWGLIWGGWEPFVWGIMLLFFVTPTVISAVLFFLAGNVVTTESNAEAEVAA
jgi:hypothetical protein